MVSSALSLDRLRSLRTLTNTIGETLVSDLRPFLHRIDKQTFRRLPTSTSDNDDIGITVTASALMGLALAGQLRTFYGGEHEEICSNIFLRIAGVKWTSSELPECNAFTTTILLRAIHLSRVSKALEIKKSTQDFNPTERRSSQSDEAGGKTYREIAILFGKDAPNSLGVVGYPPSPAIVYWFIDAIDGLSLEFSHEWWLKMAEWASKEVTRHISLVAAEYHERMDPVAMAMAACLAQRLRRIGNAKKIGSRGDFEERLPSLRELRHTIRLLFQQQLQSGIWNKYFPLFHYPKAGSNYCFAFELLEAILSEFGDDIIIEEDMVVSGFEKAVDWCRSNRIRYHHDGEDYCGWNSGGDIDSLSKGMPESWATAVSHMFLNKLDGVLTRLIERRVRTRYGEVTTSRKWEDQLDSSVTLPGGTTSTVKRLIEEHLNQGLSEYAGFKGSELRKKSLPRDQRRSVLLFGPPGTSKTTIVRAFAKRLGWPCIEITPSHFLNEGLPGIYQRANQVFADLADLSGVVILFDEMDALGRNRDISQGGGLDITSQFLTTSMLPKLAKLHDDGRVVFFMLTNHRKDMDAAITRPGRFDLMLYLGPPDAEKKVNALAELIQSKDDDLSQVKAKLSQFITDPATKDRLSRFTVGEFTAFLDTIKRQAGLTLHEALNKLTDITFSNLVSEWAKDAIILRDGSPALTESIEDQKHTKLQ